MGFGLANMEAERACLSKVTRSQTFEDLAKKTFCPGLLFVLAFRLV